MTSVQRGCQARSYGITNSKNVTAPAANVTATYAAARMGTPAACSAACTPNAPVIVAG